MTDDDGRGLSRRLHWEADEAPPTERWDSEVYRAPEPVIGGRVEGGQSFERRDLDRIDEQALDRRRQLWRDTAIILSGLVSVLLVANLVLPHASDVASATPSPAQAAGTTGPSTNPLVPGATAVPIVDPGLGIDATPRPVVAITEPPTGSAAPTHPGATPRPIITPNPTPTFPAPTLPAPTPSPTEAPTPTPVITPIPPPTVQITCTPTLLTVSCTSKSTDTVSGSEAWVMGGSGTVVTGGDGFDSITFTYDAEGTYHVMLTVTGLDGSSKSDGTDVTVSAT